MTLVTLLRPEFTEAEVEEARALAAQITESKASTPARAKAVCIFDALPHQDTPLEADVQAIVQRRSGHRGAAWRNVVELGLALKKASPFKHTFIAELANGSIGSARPDSRPCDGCHVGPCEPAVFRQTQHDGRLCRCAG